MNWNSIASLYCMRIQTLGAWCLTLLAFQVMGQCPTPGALGTSTRTNSSITLYTNSSASFHRIKYGPVGFTGPGTQTAWFAGASSTVSGLSSAMGYDFYVQDSCSNGSVSGWSTYHSDATQCGTASLPWSETFDHDRWIPSTTWSQLGTRYNCWPYTNNNGLNWDIAPRPFSTSWSGPSADHTGRSQWLTMAVVGGSNGSQKDIRTPPISLGGAANPGLLFWYHMYGSGIDKLEVQIRDINGAAAWTTIHTISGQQQSSASAAWQQTQLSLSNYVNDTIRIRFVGHRTGFSQMCEISLDDIQIEDANTCFPPSGAQSTTTTNTAAITWNAGSGASTQLSLGNNPGLGTIHSFSGTSGTLTGLNPSTTYTYWLRDSCSTSSYSSWVGPFQFTTQCAVSSAPVFENFDNAQWTAGTFNTPGTIQGCWYRPDTTGYFWKPGPDQFTNPNTGPSTDHTPGAGGKYLFTNFAWSMGSAGTQARILSPWYSTTPLDTPQVQFWYHMYGNHISGLALQIKTQTSGWVNVWTKAGQQHTSGSDAWSRARINLPGYVNDTVRFRFVGTRTNASFSFNVRMAIDDFELRNKPLCSMPTNVYVNNQTATSAQINWTGGVAPWEISYGPPGTLPGGGTVTQVSTQPYTLNGLTAGTDYVIYVRDTCGADGASDWTNGTSFATLCANEMAPWYEDFEGAEWVTPGTWPNLTPDDIPNCWARNSAFGYYWSPHSGASPWLATGPGSGVGGSGKYIMSRVTQITLTSTHFTTPWIDVSPLNTPEINFYTHMWGNNISGISVQVDNGSGWSNLATYSSGTQTAQSSPWDKRTIDLFAYQDDTLRFRFNVVRSSGWMAIAAIDSISVVEAPIPVCDPPTGAAVTNISYSSADLSFTSYSGNSWIAVVPTGGSPAPPYYSTQASSPIALQNLSPSTTYDIYILDSCGTQFLSTWVGPLTFTTLTCPSVNASFTDGGTMLNKTFIANNPASNTTYQWDFGDGSTGTGSNVTHGYANPGLYTVTLIMTNGCGNADTSSQAIQVCGAISSSFQHQMNGMSGTFTATGLGATGHYWTFGDGSSATGTPVQHTWSADGNYLVTHYAYNNCGDTVQTSVWVVACMPPTAYFTAQITSSNGSGMWVAVDASLSIGAVSYEWSWGDGATTVGGPTNSHLYGVPGLFYTITLECTSSCGGTHSYTFPLASIDLNESGVQLMRIYPNPVSAGQSFTWTINDNLSEVQAYDISGRNLSWSCTPHEDGLHVHIPAGTPPGVYTMTSASTFAVVTIQ